jgi:PPOX class probable F420-dependent enzyme
VRLDHGEARALLASAAVARLATVRSDGAPHVVPVCFAIAGGTIYTAVDAKAKRTPNLARLANIAAEPRVALLADSYEDDWTRLWWVRVDGEARIVTDAGERSRALDALARAYTQYAAAPPQGAVIAIEPLRFSGWRA